MKDIEGAIRPTNVCRMVFRYSDGTEHVVEPTPEELAAITRDGGECHTEIYGFLGFDFLEWPSFIAETSLLG
ncbi:hypothetical protein [Neorickettsia sp. 179522]|uniref:hypothetical protein n=1 Tax=Neorickettsia sp. 179522 TaxID=1714371 RepID=UPI0007983A44|nr:hypothetical protein [Neorickettsia sp. 179522]KYH12556.1 hypothetical protein AS219_01990 [Neorickettsia sp. 179522]